MKTKSTGLVTTFLKWLTIVGMITMVIVVTTSCKRKTRDDKTNIGAVSSNQGNTDSMVVRGQTIPDDAPPPPPPPPPNPFSVMNGDTVWFRVDEYPLFPGGSETLSGFIGKNIAYPETAKKKEIQGRVVVGFVLTKDCRITNARIVTGIDPDCDNEALRVVNLLPQFEKPAYVKGRPVAYHFTLPVHFKLQ